MEVVSVSYGVWLKLEVVSVSFCGRLKLKLELCRFEPKICSLACPGKFVESCQGEHRCTA